MLTARKRLDGLCYRALCDDAVAGSDGLVRKWQLDDALSAAASSSSIDLDGMVIRHR